MAITVTHNQATNLLEFKSGGVGNDDEIAAWLSKLVNDSRTVAKSTGSLAAKVRLADAVLKERRLLKAKADALLDQAAVWDERSRNWSLTKEIRDLNADRARSARDEAEKIRAELDE